MFKPSSHSIFYQKKQEVKMYLEGVRDDFTLRVYAMDYLNYVRDWLP